MFTGIISDIGTVVSTEERGDMRLWIETAYDLDTVDIGASIACAGACLTVVEKLGRRFAVDVSSESRSKTAAQRWTVGARVNLERALKVGDELGGHIVTGHVDAVGTVHSIEAVGDSREVWIAAPRHIAAFIAPKGSVALDGTSLTVNEVEDGTDHVRFSFNLIPHSAAETTWGASKTGDEVNIEIDTMARYLGRMKQVTETD